MKGRSWMVAAGRDEKTVDELLAELESDSAWVARREARAAEMRAKEERYLAEEAPLREELHRLGYRVKWVWDLVNTSQGYASAIPTLIDHLLRPYSDDIREGIARSLAVREARGQAGNAIIAALGESGLGDQLRWALANTLTIVADRTSRDGIRSLLTAEANEDVANRLRRALKTAGRP